MAVKIIQKKLTVKSLVEKIFNVSVPDMSKATELHNAGCELSVTMTRLAIKRNGVVIGTASLKMAAVTLCMQNKLGAAPTKIIRGKIIQLIADAYQKNLELKPTENIEKETPIFSEGYDNYTVKNECMPHIKDKNKIAAIKAHRNLTGASLKIAKAVVDLWWDEHWNEVQQILKAQKKLNIDSVTKTTPDGTTLEEIEEAQIIAYPGYEVDLGAKVIPLAEATLLHQSVAGTSANSRYHVIALSEGIAVAVRFDGTSKLALRAALRVHPNSKIGQQAKTALLEAGLDKKDAGHYSLHLTTDSLVMAKRCIGATLFAISSFDQISGQLQVFLGKGS